MLSVNGIMGAFAVHVGTDLMALFVFTASTLFSCDHVSCDCLDAILSISCSYLVPVRSRLQILRFVDESMGAFAVNAQKDLLQRLSSWLVPFCSRLRLM